MSNILRIAGFSGVGEDKGLRCLILHMFGRVKFGKFRCHSLSIPTSLRLISVGIGNIRRTLNVSRLSALVAANQEED
jgi:hypothetical protein